MVTTARELPTKETDEQSRASATENQDEKSATQSEERTVANVERARRRNRARLETADTADQSTLGECRKRGEWSVRNREGNRAEGTRHHLDARASTYFNKAIEGPDDAFVPPDWFLEAVRVIARTESPVPARAPLTFENNDEAAERNEVVLRSVGYDLEKLISENLGTTLGYGSEFRPITQLKPLIGGHPHFAELSRVLKFGMSYVFSKELDALTKLSELQVLLKRGNHKSAQEFPDRVSALLTKDVTHGFAIPIPVRIIKQIPNAAIQPLGLAHQWSIDEKGKRVDKWRMTQDLSFSSSRVGIPVSINSRIDMSAYVEMIYGWCMPRILHYIVALRLKYPGKVIFICKYDYSDAYRRVAHSASAATQTISVHEGRGYISLRLTYGGAPNPPTWCMFSEVVTDLANEISQCPTWEPTELHSPAQPTPPVPNRLPERIPLGQGRAMAVTIPLTSERAGRVDGFIDDLINVFVDTPENCRIQPHVVPLAIHVTSRPHAGDDREPTPRRPLLSNAKLIAEGSPAEIQIVLGWRIDTHRLQIGLPDDKFVAWSADLARIDAQKACRYDELDTLVGRLNHSSFVLPISRHFLGRIRKALTPRQHKSRMVHLGPEVLADFKLWKEILLKVHAGISINLIVTREPDRICWSDACPFGLGGYSISGRAWRLQLPKGHPLRGHPGINNLLEFTAMVVNVWLECLDSEGNQPCILAVGDSTSAIGWLFKTSKLESLPDGGYDAHLFVARHLANVLIEHNCCLASQHIRGEANVVADLLSFSGQSERGKPHPLASDDPLTMC